jgi:hypothetical protein
MSDERVVKYVMAQHALTSNNTWCAITYFLYFIVIYCCYDTRMMCYVVYNGTDDFAVEKKTIKRFHVWTLFILEDQGRIA